MFVVMNRFNVNAGKEDAFEAGWRGRETHLQEFEGFRAFALLRNDAGSRDGVTEFISHTIWRSREDFDAWRSSEQFTRAHASGGSVEGILAGPPQASTYEAVLEEANAGVVL